MAKNHHFQSLSKAKFAIIVNTLKAITKLNTGTKHSPGNIASLTQAKCGMKNTGELLDATNSNDVALQRNRSTHSDAQDYPIKTVCHRVVWNEQTGTAQPPDVK